MAVKSPQVAPPASARDPVCGMTVDPATAAAQRSTITTTYFFCSEHCAEQFDRQPIASDVPDVPAEAGTRQIELPISEVGGHRETARLREALLAVDGVRGASVNGTTQLVRVDYDPAATTIKTLVDAIRVSGYNVGVATADLGIEGMHCASCVTTIEDSLLRTAGVLSASVNAATAEARVTYLPGQADLDGITRAIEGAGYRAHPTAAAETTVDREERDRQHE